MRRLIYSKQYPKEEIKLPEKKGCNDDGQEPPSWKEMEERIGQSITYREIPGRRYSSGVFIEIATEVSNACEYDIEIYESEELVEVLLSFDSHSTSGALNRLFQMADDFSFFAGINDREITVAMDFYTVAVYRNGKRIMPDDSCYFGDERAMPGDRFYLD